MDGGSGGKGEKKGKKCKKGKKGAGGGAPSFMDCANCGTSDNTKACGRCKLVYYCSRACQTVHWKQKPGGHKEHCKTPEERSVAKAQAALSSAGAAEEGDHDNLCAICFDNLSDSPSPTLPCSHRFHASCVDELRKAGVQEVCPLCRAKLPATAEKMFDDACSIGFPIVKLVDSGQLSWGSLNREEQRKMNEAERLFTEAAKQGLPDAQFNLGNMYENGQGVKQDYSKAREWYEKAAKQGHARAQNNLGFMYYHGQSVKQDYTKAKEWYEKAVKQEHATAQNNLGFMYANVMGDYSKAREWYEKAAKQE